MTSVLGTATVPADGRAMMTFAACGSTPDDDAVMVADPPDPVAVTFPEELTVATVLSLEDHVMGAPVTAAPD